MASRDYMHNTHYHKKEKKKKREKREGEKKHTKADMPQCSKHSMLSLINSTYLSTITHLYRP